MHFESRRTRQIVMRFDRGEQLHERIVQALRELEVSSAWLTGIGSLETAEVSVADQAGNASTRSITAPTDIIALSGNLTRMAGNPSLRLVATLAHETASGPELVGGHLLSARTLSVEILATAFDDLTLVRTADDRIASEPSAAPRPTPAQAVTPPQQPATPPAPPAAQAPPRTDTREAMPAPIRSRGPAEPEAYPEPGDRVAHFLFGECTVIESDGDRIRLRQEKDGRVREVALTVLRIESPSIDPETSKRHFVLARKNA